MPQRDGGVLEELRLTHMCCACSGWLEATSRVELDVQVGLDGLIPSR